MWSKFRNDPKARWLLIGLCVLLVLGIVAACLIAFLWVPYRNARNSMPADGVLSIYEQEDGSLRLEWPEGENADVYTVDILAGEDILFSYSTQDNRSCILSELPTDETLTIRVASAAFYRGKSRPGDTALTAMTTLSAPRVNALRWETDPDTDVVQLSFDLEADTTCRMYITGQDGTTEYLESLTEGSAALTFGANGTYPVPGFDSGYTLSFDAYRETAGLVFYGRTCAQAELTREDFLGTVLDLECTELGSNAYTLTWNETKGEHYEIQQLDGEQWCTVATVPKDGELTYTTGHLAKFKDISFRVIAVGGQIDTIASEPVNVTTGAAAVYSTVWPIQDLEVYADTGRTQVLGTAPAAQAYCVLEETDGLFGIRFDDGTGYIDSSYCMINLSEYIEGLCLYDITNSYASIYMVHDYEIPEVTDTVIAGYENVELAEGQYLVPLLYPTAKKLVDAAFAAKEQGYMIKIYDSYRPQKATTSIYNLTSSMIDQPIPEMTFAEKKELEKAGSVPEATEPEETTADEEASTEETEPVVTYKMLMTDDSRYSLANFLAKGYSNHNLGVAMDLTLVSIANGEEVEMQTAIHDLSWFSELTQNNDGAKILQGIMVGAGFSTLKSEWWHFQDDQAKADLGLKPQYQGVSCQCWMRDDNGWRYRCDDGSYYTNCRKIIDGVAYHFDMDGYVTED